ncbi:putative protein N-terminal asparagine amidohydrolase [Paratrimastix pyriformis]|uniref:RRM domain-containing protein n=1 Tax=Paratrimastix pyriformis TaxID=342808 RepID=A0ABQ8UUV6_9EUKA|nr:putative protein N-terminal asparagine amidohydrolase [Paratrimastix pyriformis]
MSIAERSVLCTNISPKVTTSNLRQFLGAIGPLDSSDELVVEGQRALRASYRSAEHASTAIILNGTTLEGMPIQIKPLPADLVNASPAPVSPPPVSTAPKPVPSLAFSVLPSPAARNAAAAAAAALAELVAKKIPGATTAAPDSAPLVTDDEPLPPDVLAVLAEEEQLRAQEAARQRQLAEQRAHEARIEEERRRLAEQQRQELMLLYHQAKTTGTGSSLGRRMLFLEETPLHGDIGVVLRTCWDHAPLNIAVTALPLVTIRPETKALYIHQREHAIVRKLPDEFPFEWLGADDATTCHILIVRERQTGMSACVHLDGGRTTYTLNRLFATMLEMLPPASETHMDVHLLGGFEDDRGTSFLLSFEVFRFFMKYGPVLFPTLRLHIQTCLLGPHNTDTRGKHKVPKLSGCALHLATGALHPAHFEDEARGPAALLPLRLTVAHVPADARRTPAHPIYDPETNCIRVCPPPMWADPAEVLAMWPSGLELPQETEFDAVGDDEEGEGEVGEDDDEFDVYGEDEEEGDDEEIWEQLPGGEQTGAGGDAEEEEHKERKSARTEEDEEGQEEEEVAEEKKTRPSGEGKFMVTPEALVFGVFPSARYGGTNRMAHQLLWSDPKLLRMTSTSPHAEPARFCTDLRTSILWLLEHPKWEGVFGRWALLKNWGLPAAASAPVTSTAACCSSAPTAVPVPATTTATAPAPASAPAPTPTSASESAAPGEKPVIEMAFRWENGKGWVQL